MYFNETPEYKKMQKRSLKVCEKTRCEKCKLNTTEYEEGCLFLAYGKIFRQLYEKLGEE